MDSSGDVWVSNFGGHKLLQLRPSARELITWTLPSGAFPLGIAFDASDTVWVADYFNPKIYSFDGTNMCTYTYSGKGSAYIVFRNGKFWFGDSTDGKII